MATIQQLLSSFNAASGGASAYWNTADKGALIVLSSGDRDATNSGGTVNWDSVRSVTSHNSGKRYAELLVNAISAAGNIVFGVATSGADITNFIGAGAGGWGIQNDLNCNLRLAGSATSTLLNEALAGMSSMVAYDAALGYIWLGSNGVFYNSGDPAAGTNPTATVAAGTALYLGAGIARSGNTTTLCNQSGENVFTIPSGFSMWG